MKCHFGCPWMAAYRLNSINVRYGLPGLARIIYTSAQWRLPMWTFSISSPSWHCEREHWRYSKRHVHNIRTTVLYAYNLLVSVKRSRSLLLQTPFNIMDLLLLPYYCIWYIHAASKMVETTHQSVDECLTFNMMAEVYLHFSLYIPHVLPVLIGITSGNNR